MNSDIKPVEDAKEVYLLLKKDYRISRNVRAQWYFNNLNKICQVKEKLTLEDCSSEIEIVSIVPCNGDFSQDTEYLLTPSTSVKFLFNQYRLVFCLDLSPSVAAVDIQHGAILSDEVLPSLAKCVTGLVQPFNIPGSNLSFQPQLCITVITQVPFLTMKAQQVLVQGWFVTVNNLSSFLEHIKKKLIEVEASIVESTKIANEELDLARVGETFGLDRFKINSDDSVRTVNGIGISHPLLNSANHDCSLLNILRYGMLALQLLPEQSNAGIIVITDGVLGLPDVSLIDSLLNQLRNSSISCSFLQVGSSYHPYSCFGLVPNNDLMTFIASATYGSHFQISPSVPNNSYEVNIYHKMCLMWSFQKELVCNADNEPAYPLSLEEWSIRNNGFYSNKGMSIMRKKQSESNLNSTLPSVLSCRLREGYTLKKVNFTNDGQIEVILVYPWRPTVNIECLLRAKWPFTATNSNCHYEIAVEGNYDFLHDLSRCAKSKPPSSPFRLTLVKKYWKLLQSLSQTDQLLLRLNSFASKAVYYTVPDSNKNGVPLFFLPPNSAPIQCCSDTSHHAFSNFWKPMCMLDIGKWQKWMHTHRIGILLEHDMPLPKYLHQPNTSGRYNVIQCRQASTSLNRFLRDWSSFVLIDNQSYIKLMFREMDKPPISFYIIKVTAKAPCMVIRLAFLGGTSGYERNKVVEGLKEKILSLNFPQRAMSKEPSLPKSHNRMTHRSGDCSSLKVKVHRSPLQRAWSEINCCVLLNKPVEKILIRYERVPSDYRNPIYQMEIEDVFRLNNKDPRVSSLLSNKGGILTTLSRYLFHRRWIWGLQNGYQGHIPTQAAARILSTLIKMRLQEGFNFAYSHAGIINMVLEVELSSDSHPQLQLQDKTYCVVQYVIFPPHSTTSSTRESVSEDDLEMDGAEADGELQVITECWVEPQHGYVCNSTPERMYLESLTFQQIPEAIQKVDENCLSSMIALEHLNLMCKKENSQSPILPKREIPERLAQPPSCYVPNSVIQYIPFIFDLLGLLPKCQQAELLFSSYIQDLVVEEDDTSEITCSNDMLFQLLLQSFAEIHDAEIDLTAPECNRFMEHLLTRPRSCYYSVPFTTEAIVHPQTTQRKRESVKSSFLQELKKEEDQPKESAESKSSAKWKCFVKGVSSTHVSLSFIAASYHDLKKLIIPAGFARDTPSKSVRFKNLNVQNYSEVVSPDSSKHFVPIPQRDERGHSKDKDVKSNMFSRTSSAESANSSLDSIKKKIKRQNEIDEEDDVERPRKTGSITLPVYIYDCPLGVLVDQTLYPNDGVRFRDIFHDYTYKMDDTVEYNAKNFNSSVGFESNVAESTSKYDSPEPKSEDSDYPIDKQQLKQHCNLIKMAFAKSFVDGVYSGLRKGLYVDSADINAIVDGICEENLIEIDITNFLQAICAHVRDFQVKANLDKCKNSEISQLKKSKIGAPSNLLKSPEAENPKFPLTLLQKHLPCEKLCQLHSEIKEDFNNVLKENFKEVPCNPDYLFYCPPDLPIIDQSLNEDINDEDDNVISTDSDSEHDATFKSVEFSEDFQIVQNSKFDSQAYSPMDSPWSGASNSKFDDHIRKRHTSELNSTISSHLTNTPALFISMTCSVKVKSQVNIGTMTVRSVPTCLSEIASCLEENGSDIDLNNLIVTLDIICLNLSYEIDSGFIQRSNRMRHTTSFCSTSSPAQDGLDPNSYDNDESMRSTGSQNFQGNKAQQQAIQNIISKTTWMLTDEVASSMLDMYPITHGTLKVITKHIQDTKDVATCIMEEVPLMFVFGAELSLDKFIPEFKRLSLPNYYLAEVSGIYYLVKDCKPEQEKCSLQSSLIPPLTVSAKFPPLTLHSDDSTELRKITSTSDVSVKPVISNSMLTDSSMKHIEIFTGIKEKKLRRQNMRSGSHNESESENEDKLKDVSKTRKYRTSHDREIPSYFNFSKGAAKCDSEEEPLGHSSPKKVTEVKEKSEDEKKVRKTITSTPNAASNIATTDHGDVKVSPLIIHDVVPHLKDSFPMDSSCESSSPPAKKAPATSRHRKCQSLIKNLPGVNANLTYFSNTEDGYDGDSSDSETENHWISFLDTQRPLLPKFWLIMEVNKNAVVTYFHASQRIKNQENEEFDGFVKIQQQVVNIIRNICKSVNQSMLLQNLHDTRMCEKLLVPEANDDIWKRETVILPTGKSFSRTSGADFDDELEYGGDGHYLADTMKFKPGAFACDVVWERYFVLHHRLNTGHVRSGVSRGIQALRGVLNGFSVNNRKNMFVFRETSGSIFYLRLHENTQYNYHGRNIGGVPSWEAHGNSKAEEESSPIVSRCSSVLSLNNKKELNDTTDFDIEQNFRPRTASGTSEKDHSHDNISLSSKTSISNKVPRQAICLSVHGITEAGNETKDVLIKALQNKLDDAVLDVISTTLERNPQCKLTPDDVLFIQKPNEPPTNILRFTLPSHSVPYLQAVKFYFCQNLGQFLFNQKYTDPRPETHFQGYDNGSSDYSTPKDDVFLYNRPITSGNKGIACLVLSVIDGQGKKLQLAECLKPSSHGYREVAINQDFETVTDTNLYDSGQKKTNSPGPLASIQIKIWEKGNIDLEGLTLRLQNAIQHSLWDLFMEYKMLTAPLCEAPQSVKPAQYCLSEPSTPLKKGRSGSATGYIASDDVNHSAFNLMNYQLKEYSLSIPDVVAGLEAVKETTLQTSPRNHPANKHLAIDLESASLRSKEDAEKMTFEQGNSGHLTPLFYTSFVDYMQFGKKINVPSVKIETFEVNSRNSVLVFLSEVQKLVDHLMSNSCIQVYKNVALDSRKNTSKDLYCPITNLWTSKMTESRERSMLLPGKTADYVLISRNFYQWYCSLGFPFSSRPENTNSNSAHLPHKSMQKFLPMSDSSESRLFANEYGSHRPMPSDGQGNTSTASSPAVSTTASSFVNEQSIIIPRQHFLLLLIKDKKITLLVYNWQDDLATTLFKKVGKLSQWHSARSTVLNSLISQKMGLFHNQPYTRPAVQDENPFLKAPLQIDLLLRFHVPPTREPGAKTNFYKTGPSHSHVHQVSPSFRESFRNAKPSQPLHKTPISYFRDPLHQFGNQLVELRNSDRREMDKKLCNIWKNRGPTYDLPITDDMLKAFKQKSRMFHYCMSPFLFLLSWKLQCGLTRDHSVPSVVVEKPTKRQRNESGISIKSGKKGSIDPKPAVSPPAASRQRNISDSEEEWHVALCTSLLHEYAQYLQTLGGFIMVKTRPPSPKKYGKPIRQNKDDSATKAKTSLTFPRIYLVKHVLGGLVGVEIGFIKPFFVCRLYGLNCIMLQSRSSQNLNSQLILAFLEECDKTKVLMHLHSFTFDFHLFTIYSYISGRQLLFRQGYHMISLLDDFAKYYQKSPMFARNRIHADSLVIVESSNPGDLLFRYLLDHCSMYEMKMLKMNALSVQQDLSKVHEFALIHLSTHRVSYNDSNDTCQSEEFDMALIICHDSNADRENSTTHQFRLKFYIILTSRKGLYPKLSLDEDSGTFQIVNSCNRYKSLVGQTSIDSIFNDLASSSQSSIHEADDALAKDELDKSENSYKDDFKGSGSMCKEAVDYLGYFSSEETLMYHILQKQAENAQTRLRSIVSQALVHCRRDILWDRLLVGVVKQEDVKKRHDSKDMLPFSLTFADFTELLDLVCSVPLNEVDPQLNSFFNLHLSWYQGLTRVLINKYNDTCRVFTSSDGSIQHVVMIDPKYLETFIMMSINQKLNRSELCIVSRDIVNLENEIETEHASRPQQYANQCLIEGFVSACCYHMWCKLL